MRSLTACSRGGGLDGGDGHNGRLPRGRTDSPATVATLHGAIASYNLKPMEWPDGLAVRYR